MAEVLELFGHDSISTAHIQEHTGVRVAPNGLCDATASVEKPKALFFEVKAEGVPVMGIRDTDIPFRIPDTISEGQFPVR
jgi:hypothetical protein